MENLSRAKSVIQERYVIPFTSYLKQICGPVTRHHHGGKILKNNDTACGTVSVKIDWHTVDQWISPILSRNDGNLTEDEEIRVELAEMAVQVLQLPTMWDALKKAIARYLCADRLHVDCFIEHIASVVIGFEGGETGPDTNVQVLRMDAEPGEDQIVPNHDSVYCIAYTINLRVAEAQDAILRAVPLYNALESAMEIFIPEDDDEEFEEEGEARKFNSEADLEAAAMDRERSEDMEVVDKQGRIGKTTAIGAEDEMLDSEGGEYVELDVDDFDMSTVFKMDKKLGSTAYRQGPKRKSHHRMGTHASMDEQESAAEASGGSSRGSRSSLAGKQSALGRVSSMLFRAASRSSRNSFVLDQEATEFDVDETDMEEEDIDSYTGVSTMSDDAVRYDYEGDEYGVIEDDDLETGKPIEDLQRIARRPELARRRDLSKLFRLLQLSDNYWNPSDSESIVIEQCLEVLGRLRMLRPKERFVKAWSITKVNKMGMNQARYFVLTDYKFFTLKTDSERNNIDTKHVKFHDLRHFVMVDVGRFRQASSDKKLQPYAMCIYTSKKSPGGKEPSPHQDTATTATSDYEVSDALPDSDSESDYVYSSRSDVEEEGYEDDDDDDDIPMPEHTGPLPKEKKRGKLEKLASHGSKFIKKKIKKKLYGKAGKGQKEEDDWTADGPMVESLERPSTSNMTKHYFMANNQIHQSDSQKQFLEEVAWSVYCVAVARCGSFDNVFEPFIDTLITRPTSTGAKLYNKLKMGR